MRWQKTVQVIEGLIHSLETWSDRILASFHYSSWVKLGESLAPSLKYANVTNMTVMMSGIGAGISRIFGLDAVSYGVLMAAFLFELASGLYKSRVIKEEFTSAKLSRFSFKVCYYLLLIALTYVLSVSFMERGKETAAVIFDWMHLFFTVQIVVENVVSISENIALINGKEKSHFIQKLQDKVNKLFS